MIEKWMVEIGIKLLVTNERANDRIWEERIVFNNKRKAQETKIDMVDRQLEELEMIRVFDDNNVI